MWLVDPTWLCQKHLGGEHVEMHMFAGTLAKGVSVQGYVDGKLFEVHQLQTRHDALAAELARRGGYTGHASPLPTVQLWEAGAVDIEFNLLDLCNRCAACRANIQAELKDEQMLALITELLQLPKVCQHCTFWETPFKRQTCKEDYQTAATDTCQFWHVDLYKLLKGSRAKDTNQAQSSE